MSSTRATLLADRPADISVIDVLREHAHDFPYSLDTMWSNAVNDGPVDVIDFFSGAGGMSAGFRALNALIPAFSIRSAVDIDADANRSYRENIGVEPVSRDIFELADDPDALKRYLAGCGRRAGHPLVLIGCAPCQGFSSHRNSHGQHDRRNFLFERFADVAVAMEPDVVIMENVAELCSSAYWPHLQYAVDRLRDAGYGTHLTIHNMARFGLPQERFRAVLMASKTPFHLPAPTVERGSFRTVRQAIGRLPALTAGTPDLRDPQHRTTNHKASTLATIRSVPPDGGKRPADGGPKSLAALKQRQGKTAYEDVYGRLWWDRPSITITAYSRNPASGRFTHPEQDRGLSIREAALLQGFPSTYQFEGGFDSRFRQIGNAVPPLFAAHLAVAALGTLIDPPTGGPEPGIEAPVAVSVARLIPALKAGTATLPGGTT